jgi:Tfp pilus assembly protein PilV
VLQQQKEEQQKANLARLQQAKEERAQREAEAHMHTHMHMHTHTHMHNNVKQKHTCTSTNAHVHAHTHTCTGTGWAKCPPGLVQGRLKSLFTGYPELPLIFLRFGHRGEYAKVR